MTIKPELAEAAPKAEIADEQKKKVRRFRDGDIARAEHMNALCGLIILKAENHGLKDYSVPQFHDGEIADAEKMNAMLDAVDSIYSHMGKQPPQWSFGRFKNGMVLRASNMNEIIDNTEAL